MDTSSGQPAHLHDYLAVLNKRKWLVFSFMSALILVVTFISLNKRPIYQASCQLLIEKERPEAVSFQEAIGIDTVDNDYYQTQYKILHSRSLAKKVVDAIDLERVAEFYEPRPGLLESLEKFIFKVPVDLEPLDKESIIDRFLKAVIIEPVRKTRLVRINARAYDPELAATIANTLAQTYVKQNLESKLFASRQVLNQLFPQIDSDPDRTDISELILSLPSVVNHDLIKKLKEESAEIEVEYATLSKRYGPKHPKMIAITSALEEMMAKIKLETKRVAASVKTELAGNFKSNNIRIIDPASAPKKALYPRTRLNIILSIIGGLVLGCGLAFFVEYLDSTVKNPKDITNFLGLSLLGNIPHIKAHSRRKKNAMYNLSQSQPRSQASEAFRSIRTRLSFLTNGGGLNKVTTVLISSAGPSEGKTLVAINLANSLAQAGRRVLLVDADMRRPSVHKYLHVDNSFGFSNYLKRDLELGRVIQQNSIENLRVIPSGPLPSNPSELLDAINMEVFCAELKDEFDWVIFDASPVSVSDAVILGKLVDGVIQVVHSGKYHRNMVNQARQTLEENEINLIGAVLNNISMQESGYSYYSSYYYGGYYQQNDKSKKAAVGK